MEDGALSLYQQQALENRYLSPGDVFATGMGDEAREYLEFVAGEPIVFATRPGERTCAAVRVEGVDGAAVEAAKDALMAGGYEAEVYGRPVAELVDEVMALARRGLAADEQGFLEPLAQLVAQRVTLADLAERKVKPPSAS